MRPVRLGDLAVICGHRRRMFEEAGKDAVALDAMQAPFADWLRPRLEDGRYFGFVVEDGGTVIAGVGLMLLDWPPHPLHPESSSRGYVLNVFVEPAHRGRGIAVELMLAAEAEFRRRGVVYQVLHASDLGRPVYEGLGWEVSPEMGKAV